MTVDSIIQSDCVQIMRGMAADSVDFILTDPPYLVNYRDRSGRRVANDRKADWLEPAFREMYRLLKPNTLCVSFYGWPMIDLFMTAWKDAGFTPVGHLVWRKDYASRTVTFGPAKNRRICWLRAGRVERRVRSPMSCRGRSPATFGI